MAPLVDISQGVEKAQVIRLEPADRVRVALCVVQPPGKAREQGVVITERPDRRRAGAAAVFPLGLGRQAIARPLEVVVREPHPRMDLVDWRVAHLRLGNLFLLAEPAAVTRGFVP